MTIGNWKITKTGIEWSGDAINRFSIEARQLAETVTIEPGMAEMYKWILLATEEDWLSHDDLYDFNHAFIYATASTGQPFDYEVFDRTVTYQYELLDEEIEEQPSMHVVANDEQTTPAQK